MSKLQYLNELHCVILFYKKNYSFILEIHSYFGFLALFSKFILVYFPPTWHILFVCKIECQFWKAGIRKFKQKAKE
jgi:hypothetical protein